MSLRAQRWSLLRPVFFKTITRWALPIVTLSLIGAPLHRIICLSYYILSFSVLAVASTEYSHKLAGKHLIGPITFHPREFIDLFWSISYTLLPLWITYVDMTYNTDCDARAVNEAFVWEILAFIFLVLGMTSEVHFSLWVIVNCFSLASSFMLVRVVGQAASIPLPPKFVLTCCFIYVRYSTDKENLVEYNDLNESKAIRNEVHLASSMAESSHVGAKVAVHSLLSKTFGQYDLFLKQVRALVEEAKSGLTREDCLKLERGEIRFEEFELERKLTSGGFCTVYRASLKTASRRPCAVKSFSHTDTLSIASLKGFVNEVVLLMSLDHPHIIKVLGYCWHPHVCLVLEFMPKGTLHDMLSYRSLSLSWDSPLLELGTQIASALHFLHTRNPPIVHRDIKTRNILMLDFRTCKLADFGLSVLQSAASRAGTVRYVAPEVVLRGETTIASDLWSFGVCLWEMASRMQFPYSRNGVVETDQPSLPRQLPYAIPQDVILVINGLLRQDQHKRLPCDVVKTMLHQCLVEVRNDTATLLTSGVLVPTVTRTPVGGGVGGAQETVSTLESPEEISNPSQDEYSNSQSYETDRDVLVELSQIDDMESLRVEQLWKKRDVILRGTNRSPRTPPPHNTGTPPSHTEIHFSNMPQSSGGTGGDGCSDSQTVTPDDVREPRSLEMMEGGGGHVIKIEEKPPLQSELQKIVAPKPFGAMLSRFAKAEAQAAEELAVAQQNAPLRMPSSSSSVPASSGMLSRLMKAEANANAELAGKRQATTTTVAPVPPLGGILGRLAQAEANASQELKKRKDLVSQPIRTAQVGNNPRTTPAINVNKSNTKERDGGGDS